MTRTVLFALAALSLALLAGGPHRAMAQEDGWTYQAGRVDGVVVKRAVLRIDWYLYNDFGSLQDVRSGELTVRRDGAAVTVDLWTGGGPVCSEQRRAVEVQLAFDDAPRERQSWPVAADRSRFEPRDVDRFLARLRAVRALWLQVADGCGWPWRSEVWIADGHGYIERVLEQP